MRYPNGSSINSDQVPFIVIPGGSFGSDTGVQVGDGAAVVYQGKKIFGVVADTGPTCKVGEASIRMHELVGHKVNRKTYVTSNSTKP